MTIISFAGWAGSGKTRASEILSKEKGFTKAKFAAPIKSIVERAAGVAEGAIEHLKGDKTGVYVSEETLATEILVQLGLSRWAAEQRLIEPSVHTSGIAVLGGVTTKQMLLDLEEISGEEFANMTYRQVLQKLGTDIMRNKWRKDIHVCMQEDWIMKNKHKNIVYDDVRFPNEITLLKKYGASTYWLHRPALSPQDRHESEVSLGESDCEYVIVSREGSLLDEDIRHKF